MEDESSDNVSSSEDDFEDDEEVEESELGRDLLREDETTESNPKAVSKKRKKRKKARGHRRNIKSKYDTIEDLNPEAVSAQTEEAERIRRLELQQSILKSENPQTTGPHSHSVIKRKDSIKR